MRVLSPVLDRLVYPTLGAVGYFHSHPAATVRVITYHGLLPVGYKGGDAFLDNTLVTAEVFQSQLRLLKRHYNVISPDQFLLWLLQGEALPERASLLTCDDGLLNHLSVMLPILREEQLQCLFFVTGSSLTDKPEILWYVELYLMLAEAPEREQPLALHEFVIPEVPADRRRRRTLWLELLKTLSRVDAAQRRQFLDKARAQLRLSPTWSNRFFDDPLLRQRFQLLRPAEVKQLAEAGMTIGAHTLSHPQLAEVTAELACDEIAVCRENLERLLGQRVWALAYPFGDPSSVGARECRIAEQSGYDCAFVNVGGALDSASAKFALPRIHVTAGMSLSVYEAHISGVHDALRSRFQPQAKNFLIGG